MKKLLFLSVLFFLCAIVSRASHIVGGEIEMIYLRPSAYKLNVNLYFDATNGRPQAEDLSITIYIFRKSDNGLMAQFRMPQVAKNFISYTNPNCSNSTLGLRTYLIQYSTDVLLNASSFNDPQGYYVVWERCCRNSVISNLVNPGSTGSAFYLEIPPMVVDGQSFINSSPSFQPLKSDYICIRKPFVFDFSGKDTDGDSLAYSLVTPLAGFASTGAALPISVGSSNYPLVNLLPGYSNQNLIPGTVPLSINPLTGRLFVVADRLGLYVFCVQVDEFRKGKRIGRVRRDFQFEVVDCPPISKPEIFFREQNKSVFYKKGEVVRIGQDQEKCFTILLTDKDLFQRVSLSAKGLNFGDRTITLTPDQYTVAKENDTLRVKVCLDKCVESTNGQPLILELIASDESCPQPLYDTLTVRLNVEPALNRKPRASTDLVGNLVNARVDIPLTFKVLGADLDNDDLTLEAFGRGFALSQVGMRFVNVAGKGAVNQVFNWTPPCAAGIKENYTVDFVVTDSRCGRNLKDTVTVNFKVSYRKGVPPVMTTMPPTTAVNYKLSSDQDPLFRFDVLGNDRDADQITVTAKGRGFDLAAAGMRFQSKTAVASLSSAFEWRPDCSLLNGRLSREFTVDFLLEDNSCGPIKTDTLAVKFLLDDVAIDFNLKPGNVITPNGDGKNDCFSLGNLPPDNCVLKFNSIIFYNRWGARVFETTDKNFSWCADGLPGGEYYYYVQYSSITYKGLLTVLK